MGAVFNIWDEFARARMNDEKDARQRPFDKVATRRTRGSGSLESERRQGVSHFLWKKKPVPF